MPCQYGPKGKEVLKIKCCKKKTRGEAEIKWRKWVGGTGAFWATEKTLGRSAKKKHME